MPVKTVTFRVSTTISAALRLLFTSFLLCSHFISLFLSLSPCLLFYYLSLYLFRLSTTLILLLFLTQCFFCSVYKILGCIFSDVMHLPTLCVFILSHWTEMCQNLYQKFFLLVLNLFSFVFTLTTTH